MILVGVCGGIAAYKTCDLVRQLVRAGHEVQVVQTRDSQRFVGPTTVYAFMQAMGLVNDHLHGCDARGQVEQARAIFVPPR